MNRFPLDPFRDRARDMGIPHDEVERYLDAAVRPCAILGTYPEAGAPVVGQLGGLPSLPDGEPVPNLPFLASVDLAAIPQDATDLPLPTDGTLYFFADTSELTPLSIPDWARLVHVPAGSPSPTHGSDGAPPRSGQDLYLAINPSLPNQVADSDEFPHLEELREVWWDDGREMQTSGSVQVGGYPWVWNNDPTTDYDRVHGPGDWVLLAEFATGDDDLMGQVHWVIQREDLAAGRFSEALAYYDIS